MSASTTLDLKSISESMESSTPQEILAWAASMFGAKLLLATAFGAEGCVLLAMLADIYPQIHAINLETGYQFRETLELRDRIEARYGIAVDYVRAAESVDEMESRFGGPIYRSHPDECCRIRKIEPLKEAVKGFEAWISAIRRDQTHARKSSGIVEWDSRFNLVKVNPLANWTSDDVWDYIRANDVPYNPLHDEGYPSIGCWPCTHPADVGQDDRAGRWAGSAKVECGLHGR